MNFDQARPFGLLAIGGLLLSALVWARIAERGGHRDRRLTMLYFCALLGAIVGAKVAFFVAEGWHYRDDWLALLSGRSITGGLLGGYAGVEWGKRRLGYERTTGDLFAVVVPIGLAVGRVGCWINGCCAGVACEPGWWTLTDAEGVTRWPAQPLEGVFNVLFAAWAWAAMSRGWQVGNRFHVYLVAYGLFRFAHEFMRDDSRWGTTFSGYHLWALALIVFGALRYAQRRPPTAAAALAE